MRQSSVKWVFLALGLPLANSLAGQAPLGGGYGESVAVGGGDVIVGQSLNETSPGYVYIYRKDSRGAWAEVQRFEASNSTPGDHFAPSCS